MYESKKKIEEKEMEDHVVDMYLGELSEIVAGLPEEKLRKIIAFARSVTKEEEKKPTTSLSTEEILVLASERAAELRRHPRPVVAVQYQTLLQALEAEVAAKGIDVEEYPRGD
jgi:hypothetical protein